MWKIHNNNKLPTIIITLFAWSEGMRSQLLDGYKDRWFTAEMASACLFQPDMINLDLMFLIWAMRSDHAATLTLFLHIMTLFIQEQKYLCFIKIEWLIIYWNNTKKKSEPNWASHNPLNITTYCKMYSCFLSFFLFKSCFLKKTKQTVCVLRW